MTKNYGRNMSEQFLITNTNSVQQVSRNYYIITRLGPLP